MKLIYLSNSVFPSRTANSVQVIKMCAAFSAHGHDVTLIGQKGVFSKEISEYYSVSDDFKIRTFSSKKRKVGLLSYILKSTLYIIFGKGNDLVYGRFAFGLLPIALLRTKCVYEIHKPPNTKATRIVETMLINRKCCERIVVISHALREKYIEMYPSVAGKIIVVPDASDILEVDNVESIFSDKKFRVGYVGHLYAGKGMELISKLAPLLPTFEFHIVGGTEEDLAFWRQHCETVPNIIFHGFIEQNSLPRFYHGFEVMLAPYQNAVSAQGNTIDIAKWMSPLKIFEYMAAKKPIIASDIPVLKEVLRNNYNAILCDPSSVDEWVHALEHLSQDTALREKIANTAYHDFKSHYTWDRRVEKVLSGLKI